MLYLQKRRRCLQGLRFMGVLVAVATLCVSMARAAGFQKVTAPAGGNQPAMEVHVWTPCRQAVQKPMSVGVFRLQAIPGCPLVGSGKLPLVVMSHGRGGTALGHHDTAEALADAGFIVASFNHPGDNAFDMRQSDNMAALYQRPAQVKQVLDFMLSRSPLANRIDASRIGFWGFSRGGYTGLVLAGATPDFANSQLPCPDKHMKICRQIAANSKPAPALVRDARIQAVVAVDPLSFFPTPESVQAVRVPVQIWASQHGGDGVTPQSVRLLAQNLHNKPELVATQRTNHYAFIHPCTPALAALEKAICTQDEPGFDRAAAHKQWNVQMANFFKKALAVAR